ncbi:AAA family ATPase [Enterococcus faecalis]|uniref:AAA family ATPase n=1 Tax=Enterococcus faecalis TaxID=1351 RepID=UPI00205863E0|nr:ATP-binding protein [Enterococcus faecalis]EIB6115909.1 ATP-binding protein [Enterococcus faecalis]BDH63928.1 ATPase [Enterococcus sp. PLM3]
MYSEILKIIEGGISHDKQKVINYSKRLAEYLIEDGQKNIGNKINKLIAENNTSLTTLDGLSSKPFDKDTKVDMVDIFIPTESKESLIFNEIVENEVLDFINSYLNRDKLIMAGIDFNNHLLLYGKPGTGKTSLAKFISLQTGLPLITARLDGIVSSLLGNTAKNIRKVFDYASQRPCVLFLDEFDVLAKIRDDKNELGELKRVVNSLLQNMDNFNEDSILIAATNHEKLLDEAVWRRFDKIIKLDLPDSNLRKDLILEYSSVMATNFSDDQKKMTELAYVTEGYSPADIKNVVLSAAKKTLIRNDEILNYSQLLYEIFLREHIGEDSMDEPIKYLLQHKVSQKEVSTILNVSLRKIRNLLKEEE